LRDARSEAAEIDVGKKPANIVVARVVVDRKINRKRVRDGIFAGVQPLRSDPTFPHA